MKVLLTLCVCCALVCGSLAFAAELLPPNVVNALDDAGLSSGLSTTIPIIPERSDFRSAAALAINSGSVAATSPLTTADLALVGANPVWVDDSWVGTAPGTVVDGHVFGTDAFANITDGITAVDAGGVVNVLAGIYVENLTIAKALSLVGVGYKAAAQGTKLNLTVGYSHPVDFVMPAGITVATPTPTEIVIKGSDRQRVGQIAAEVRASRVEHERHAIAARHADGHRYVLNALR